MGGDATSPGRRLSAAADRELGRVGLQVVRSARLRGLEPNYSRSAGVQRYGIFPACDHLYGREPLA